ncbi:MAG TPA: nitronate monooxygenase, partial [Rhodoferax sp.]|nr:nitronate monooxygenase [Rhodoferax sp.]
MLNLQSLLNIELPIVQAPMAGAQGSAMAVAVSNAGALGSLPCAMLSLQAMCDELTVLRAQTTRPYNVNFFCHTPPVVDAARDARWAEALAPYFHELGLDPASSDP